MPEFAVYSIPLRHRFRGIMVREGVIWRGAAGWAEWSPFVEYPPHEAAAWRRAALEAATVGFPPPRRTSIPVNVTVPATQPEVAYELVRASGCLTAKVKVAEAGQTLTDDVARVEAVRAALGPTGHLRVDANGAWDVEGAVTALTALQRYDLQYAEQPCASVDELAAVRARVHPLGILIAADESIRRTGDPFAVRDRRAADIAVLKVQPLGGVRACLDIARRIDMDVVVSSAIETSVGLRAGVALAAALPELTYACGLATASLLASDVTADPLGPTDGAIPVRDVVVDEVALAAVAADAATTAWWQQRWRDCDD